MLESLLSLAGPFVDHSAWTMLVVSIAIVLGVSTGERGREPGAGPAPAEELGSWTRGTR